MVALAGRMNRNRLPMVLGWMAIATWALLASIVAGLAAETLAVGHSPTGLYLAQVASLMIFGIVALRWPQVGGAMVVFIALGLVLRLAVPRLMVDESPAHALQAAAPVFLPMTVVGLLYFFGRPSPRRLAYLIVLSVPASVFVIGLAKGASVGLAG